MIMIFAGVWLLYFGIINHDFSKRRLSNYLDILTTLILGIGIIAAGFYY